MEYCLVSMETWLNDVLWRKQLKKQESIKLQNNRVWWHTKSRDARWDRWQL